MRSRIFAVAVSLATAFALPLHSTQLQAQPSASQSGNYGNNNRAARIDGFDVRPLARASAGGELVFTLYGSPGGTAAVQINGATGGTGLVEVETGIYEGTYTIRQRDRINADSLATANLRVGNSVASVILDEPMIGSFRQARRGDKDTSSTSPRIDRFEVDAPQKLVAGEELMFSMRGTPGAKASARIAGVRGKVVMNETSQGVYEGVYALRNRDRLSTDSVVTGNLRVGDRESTSVLRKPLVADAASSTSTANAANTPRARRVAAAQCANCGVIEAVNLVEVKGEGTYLGKIAGGLAGVLLGSQIGSGSGTTVAQVAGAVGGAYAGNEIEKRVKSTTHHEVVVRLENGGTQTVAYATNPGHAIGTRVKVEAGVLTVLQ